MKTYISKLLTMCTPPVTYVPPLSVLYTNSIEFTIISYISYISYNIDFKDEFLLPM
jgi:hypothetical protein